MADQKEIDRWRRSLEEAEAELEEKSKQWQEAQTFLCSTITKFARLVDSDELALSSEINAVIHSAKNEDDYKKLKKTVTTLSKKILQVEAFVPVSVDATQSTVAKKASPDPAQYCALFVSEILYQLLEKISLPHDLSTRLAQLKKQLEAGVTLQKWTDMLNEIADMASYIQVKISHERLDIEAFLKQVTGRLQELDSFIQGTKTQREQSWLSSQAFGDAVKSEMKSLVSSANDAQEIDDLKKQIQTRLAAIEEHFDGYNEEESNRQKNEAVDVQKLLSRLTELEEESKNLKVRVEKERMQAQIDPLTGVANRLGYDHRINQEYARWKRYKNPLSLIVWDIDHFKRINDDYGHAAGDKALKTIAKLISSKVRETDYFARFGGEEFILIMTDTGKTSAKSVADKLREVVENSGFHFKGSPVTITISAGVAEFADNDAPQSVFERADAALYKAKEAGRNQVVIA